ncbi:type IX secretion system membrane protein PorP/SprF, partial [Cellulophaga baltica]
SVNPAYAGSRGVLSIAALHRSQWVGLDGAPTTQTLNLHTPVSRRVGLGLSIVNDEIGNGTNQDTYFDA